MAFTSAFTTAIANVALASFDLASFAALASFALAFALAPAFLAHASRLANANAAFVSFAIIVLHHCSRNRQGTPDASMNFSMSGGTREGILQSSPCDPFADAAYIGCVAVACIGVAKQLRIVIADPKQLLRDLGYVHANLVFVRS